MVSTDTMGMSLGACPQLGTLQGSVGALRDFPRLLSSPVQLFLACWAGKCVSGSVTKPCHLLLVQLLVRRGCQ